MGGEGFDMEWLHNLLGGSSPITGYLGSLIICVVMVTVRQPRCNASLIV